MVARVRNHLLFWILYVCFKAFLNYSGEETLSVGDVSNLLLTQVLLLMVKVPLVYGSFSIIDKYLENRWGLGKVILVMAVAFLAGAYGMFIINVRVVLPFIRHIEPNTSFGFISAVYYFFTLLFVVGVALSIRLFRKQSAMKVREARLEKEKTEAELKYLKGQINPHFLFNTLNNIYALARKGSDRTAESVLKMATLMRFTLYESSSSSIPLKTELKIIEDYIELEKLRYSDRLKVDFTADVDEPEKPIAPLLLIHFVENAFKHGASESRTDVDVKILIRLRKSMLTAEISNPLGDSRVSQEPVQIGMENTKRQLELLYPGHSLKIDLSGGRFTVRLSIPLNQPA